jgi:hypothetical protein
MNFQLAPYHGASCKFMFAHITTSSMIWYPARHVDEFNLVDLDPKIAKSTLDDFLEPAMDTCMAIFHCVR